MRLEGCWQIDDEGEQLVFHLDESQRIFRAFLRIGGNGRNLIADKAGRVIEDITIFIPVTLRCISGAEHGTYTGQRLSTRSIDLSDTHMWQRPPQDAGAQQSW